MLPPYSRLARGLRVRTAPGRLAHGKDHLGSFREGQCRNRVVSLPGIVAGYGELLTLECRPPSPRTGVYNRLKHKEKT